jgi:two-component system sensor histidine kinase AgrC
MQTILQSVLPLFISAMPAYTAGAFIYLTLPKLQPLLKKLLLSILFGLVCGLICGFAAAIGDLFIFINVMLFHLIYTRKGKSVYRQHQLAWLVTIFNIISLQTTFTSTIFDQSKIAHPLVISASVSSILAVIIVGLYLHYYAQIKELTAKLDPHSSFTKSLTTFTALAFLSQSLMTIVNSFMATPSQGYWLLNSVAVLINVACVYMTVSHTQAAASIEQSHAIMASQTATEVFSTQARESRLASDKLLHDYKNIIQSLQTAYGAGNVNLSRELSDAQRQLATVHSPNFSLDGLEPGLITGLFVNEWLKADQQNTTLSLQNNLTNIAFKHEIQLPLSRILGILIDNAIDATAAVVDKSVGISLYAEPNHDVTINIRNHVPAEFKITHLATPGFTTKGTDHGHGWTNIRELTQTTPSLRCLPRLDATTLTVKVTIDHTEVTYDVR